MVIPALTFGRTIETASRTPGDLLFLHHEGKNLVSEDEVSNDLAFEEDKIRKQVHLIE